jgi:divalent metal cation (Fe/Co/Zn/Cd) transporter
VALLLGKGYESADDWAALFASGFILFNAYLIFRPALGEIMDEHVHDDLIEKIRATSNQVEGIIDTENAFIRKAGMKYHVDLHAIVNAMITVKEGHDLALN